MRRKYLQRPILATVLSVALLGALIECLLAAKEPVVIQGYAWDTDGSLRLSLRGFGTGQGDTGATIVFGPRYPDLRWDEFEMLLDLGGASIPIWGTYELKDAQKGHLSLILDEIALEKTLEDTLTAAYMEPFCVRLKSAALKARARIGYEGTSLRLILRARFSCGAGKGKGGSLSYRGLSEAGYTYSPLGWFHGE